MKGEEQVKVVSKLTKKMNLTEISRMKNLIRTVTHGKPGQANKLACEGCSVPSKKQIVAG